MNCLTCRHLIYGYGMHACLKGHDRETAQGWEFRDECGGSEESKDGEGIACCANRVNYI